MATFWRLLEESVITQAMVTLILIGVVAFMVVTEKAVPEILVVLSSTALGYYFGAKGALTGAQAAKAVIQELTAEE